MPTVEAEQLASALHGWLEQWLADGLVSQIDGGESADLKLLRP